MILAVGDCVILLLLVRPLASLARNYLYWCRWYKFSAHHHGELLDLRMDTPTQLMTGAMVGTLMKAMMTTTATMKRMMTTMAPLKEMAMMILT
jgi:hypothetical protein